MSSDNNDSALEVVHSDNTALESFERVQVDAQIATAKRYPRTLSKIKADMLSFATLDEETAAACFYTLPRGGKVIQGPSVRLAEIAVACYGNLRAGARPVQVVTSGDMPHVVVQAVAHDLENNTAITIEKRRRITKKKSKDAPDEDDVNLAVNACSAIAFRDAVFKTIPQALIRPVYEQAKRVAVGDIKSLADKRGKVMDRLKQMGVVEERILARVDARKADDIDLDKLEILIGLGTALKDGETSLEKAFPAVVAKVDVIGKDAAPKADDKPAVNQLDALKVLLEQHEIAEADLVKWAAANKHIAEGMAFSQIPAAKAATFIANFDKVAKAVKGGAS